MTPAERARLFAAPLALPCGVELPNRVLKSAMSEILGTRDHGVSPGLVRLYEVWAAGGTGTLVTGNVMVDRRALGEPGNVVLEDDRDAEAFARWAAAGRSAGGHVWVQLNHPGKQSPRFLSKQPVAPSAIPLGAGLERAFAAPRALEDGEVLDIIERFGRAAGLVKAAGFTGLQIHGAHGYLVSQFLSPHHNQRTDRWGGSPEKRRAFVLAVYEAVRGAVGPGFPVSIKLNSADFRQGGFTEEESLAVVGALEAAGIDLIEVSGGTYEAPAMSGAKAERGPREAYFLRFAEAVRAQAKVPVAVTGGFRSADAMAEALASGAVDVVGLARPLALEPDLPLRLLAGEEAVSQVRRLSTGVKALDRMAMLEVTWYEVQLARLAAGKSTNPRLGPWRSLASTLAKQGTQAFRMRRAR